MQNRLHVYRQQSDPPVFYGGQLEIPNLISRLLALARKTPSFPNSRKSFSKEI
jgi:hypothetical protein